MWKSNYMISDWLSRPLWQLILIIFCLGILLYFISYVIWLKPLNDEIAEQNHLIRQNNLQISQLTLLQPNNLETNQSLITLAEHQLINLVNKNDLILVDFKNYQHNEDELWDIKLTGKFNHFMDFLKLIAKEKYAFTIQQLAIHNHNLELQIVFTLCLTRD